MCGRFALATEHEALRIRYGVIDFDIGAEMPVPRYNVAPTQRHPVVIASPGPSLKMMQWGLIPHWADNPSIGNKLINARSETVESKPSFRDAFRQRRCLVPATGFFEWKTAPQAKRKVPMYITLKDQDIFSMAGIWSGWKDPAGSDVFTFAILTTEANRFMKEIHERMPVILDREREAGWLNPATAGRDLKDIIATSYPAEGMLGFPVSDRVNSPRCDEPICITSL